MKLIIENKEFEISEEVSDLIISISKERDELQDLVIWMTGCGYDFCQHEYFITQRDELLKGLADGNH